MQLDSWLGEKSKRVNMAIYYLSKMIFCLFEEIKKPKCKIFLQVESYVKLV